MLLGSGRAAFETDPFLVPLRSDPRFADLFMKLYFHA
jgi:hypothetical protein